MFDSQYEIQKNAEMTNGETIVMDARTAQRPCSLGLGSGDVS